MKNIIQYQWIGIQHVTEINKLAICLTHEIIERTGVKHFDIDVAHSEVLCRNFIEQEKYYVLAAFKDQEVIGFGALCESYALYAEGAFGILQEFFVLPEYRSQNIGQALIQKIQYFAESKQWKRIELCTPPLPEFDRTVVFYQQNGFERTGGYKMKWVITP